MTDFRQSAYTIPLTSELNPPIQHPIALSLCSRLYFECVGLYSTERQINEMCFPLKVIPGHSKGQAESGLIAPLPGFPVLSVSCCKFLPS